MEAIKALRALFGRTRMSDEEFQAAVDRSMERQWEFRHPEAPGVLDDYMFFTGEYSFLHDAGPMEAHKAAMKAHPKWWPETLPQPPKPDYEPEPAYSP